MRDPERIRRICNKLAAAWAAQPDSRIGQIIVNLCPPGGVRDDGSTDPFYVEDDVIEHALDARLREAGIDPNAALVGAVSPDMLLRVSPA